MENIIKRDFHKKEKKIRFGNSKARGEKDKGKERSGKHIQIKIKSGNRIKIWDREGKEKRKIGRHIK